MHLKRLSVLGVGLLGGSIGMAVKSRIRGCVVTGYGHRPETLRAALLREAIDEAYDDPRDAVRDADLVILCTPVGLLCPLLDQILPGLAPGAAVTDVGSTKRSIVHHADAQLARLSKKVHFVGSHPMAGSEKRGVQFADAELFNEATCVLTPSALTDPQALADVDAFWSTLGMKTLRMSPEEHDRRAADVSHLPHAVAAALVDIQTGDSLAFAGKGFTDTTRIAGGDGGLWRDILLDNRDNLRVSLSKLQASLATLLSALDASDADAVQQWLDTAAEKRRQAMERSSNIST